MSDVKMEFKENKFEFGLDSDNDGVKSLEGVLNLSEVVAEAFKKGTKVEGVKTASIEFSGMEVHIKIDTDKDGEPAFIFKANLPEGFDEATKRF